MMMMMMVMNAMMMMMMMTVVRVDLARTLPTVRLLALCI
jgi:hypothetical protein